MNKAYVKDYESALKYEFDREFDLPKFNHGTVDEQLRTQDTLPHLVFADYVEEQGHPALAHIMRKVANPEDKDFEGHRFIDHYPGAVDDQDKALDTYTIAGGPYAGHAILRAIVSNGKEHFAYSLRVHRNKLANLIKGLTKNFNDPAFDNFSEATLTKYPLGENVTSREED